MSLSYTGIIFRDNLFPLLKFITNQICTQNLSQETINLCGAQLGISPFQMEHINGLNILPLEVLNFASWRILPCPTFL